MHPLAATPPVGAKTVTHTVTCAVTRIVARPQDHIAEHYKNMRRAFAYIDLDNSGKISAKEMERTLQMWNLPVPHEVVQKVPLRVPSHLP